MGSGPNPTVHPLRTVWNMLHSCPRVEGKPEAFDLLTSVPSWRRLSPALPGCHCAWQASMLPEKSLRQWSRELQVLKMQSGQHARNSISQIQVAQSWAHNSMGRDVKNACYNVYISKVWLAVVTHISPNFSGLIQYTIKLYFSHKIQSIGQWGWDRVGEWQMCSFSHSGTQLTEALAFQHMASKDALSV